MSAPRSDGSDPVWVHPDWPARRAKGRPGLHALVVGVGDYRYLPGADGAAPAGGHAPNGGGLTKIGSAARGAIRLAAWLRRHADQLTPRLATLRLLLSADPNEPELAALWLPYSPEYALPYTRPTLANLRVAVEAWRGDADGHTDGTTLFHFSGHGVQRYPGDHVLLLDEFGGRGTILSSAVVTAKLIEGMRLSGGRKDSARRQLYFFDACKLPLAQFSAIEKPEADGLWDPPVLDAPESRQYFVYSSAVAGAPAHGEVSGGSLFCSALIEALEIGAVQLHPVSGPGQNPCQVRAHGLKPALEQSLARLANQPVPLGFSNEGPDFQIRTFTQPPQVRVDFHIDPGAARHCVGFDLLNANDTVHATVDPPADNPHSLSVPCGLYRVRGRDPSDPRLYVEPQLFFLPVIPPQPVANLPFVPVGAPSDPVADDS